MDHLRAMRLFVRVAELGSLGAASTDLGYARGAGSAILRDLESYLGVTLMERTTRSLRLTEDGLAYLERARRILSEVEEMESEIGSAERQPRGTLRIQVPAGIARIALAPALPRFLESYPGLSVELLSRNEMPDFVGQGLDAALYGGILPDSDLIARKICTLPMMLAATPDYLARRGTPQTLEDLDAHDCLGFVAPRSRQPVVWNFRVEGQPVSYTPSGRLTFEAADACKAAVMAHAGLMQMGVHMAEEELAEGRLVRVLEALRPAPTVLSLLQPRHRHKPRKLRVFEDFILQLGQDLRQRLSSPEA